MLRTSAVLQIVSGAIGWRAALASWDRASQVCLAIDHLAALGTLLGDRLFVHV